MRTQHNRRRPQERRPQERRPQERRPFLTHLYTCAEKVTILILETDLVSYEATGNNTILERVKCECLYFFSRLIVDFVKYINMK